MLSGWWIWDLYRATVRVSKRLSVETRREVNNTGLCKTVHNLVAIPQSLLGRTVASG
jgi:hypothetical protein